MVAEGVGAADVGVSLAPESTLESGLELEPELELDPGIEPEPGPGPEPELESEAIPVVVGIGMMPETTVVDSSIEACELETLLSPSPELLVDPGPV